MVKRAIKDVSSTNLRSYHKELTKAPHIAGLKRDQELTQWIKDVRSISSVIHFLNFLCELKYCKDGKY